MKDIQNYNQDIVQEKDNKLSYFTERIEILSKIKKTYFLI